MRIKCPDCGEIFELDSTMIVNDNTITSNSNESEEDEKVKDLNENAPISNSVSGMDTGLMGALDNITMGSPTGGKTEYHNMDANAPAPVDAAPVEEPKKKRAGKKTAATIAAVKNADTFEATTIENAIATVDKSAAPDTVPMNFAAVSDIADTDSNVNTDISGGNMNASVSGGNVNAGVSSGNDSDDNSSDVTATAGTTSDPNDPDSGLFFNTDASGVVNGSAKYGFNLTNDNYYSAAADKIFLSNSKFKAVYGTPVHPYACEDAAINGPKAESEALLIGGYVDSWFEGQAAFDAFKADHQDQLLMKSGKDYYKFVKDADEAIDKVSKDQVFMDYAKKGSHQTIMVGEIAGHPFKIKMDAYHSDKIVDVKYVKDAGMVWNDIKKERITFIEDYGYNIQGAIYQEIVYQNTGKKLPFYIAFITKEKDEADFDIVQIDQKILDEALEYVKMQLISRPYAEVLKDPQRCGRKKCPWCKSKKTLLAPKTYDEFVKYCS